MAPILNTHTSSGLPVCLSGITHPIVLSREIADQDRRRKGFQKLRLRVARGLHAAVDQDNFFGAPTQSILQDRQLEGVSQWIRDEVSGDPEAVALLRLHLSCISISSCAAKAA